jgi:type II secretory pathway pseudopilin PulG
MKSTSNRSGNTKASRQGDSSEVYVCVSPYLPVSVSFRRGHTLIELVFAMAASAVLLAGLGSVMLIARQVAYAPAASSRRLEASQIANQLADEVRAATFFVAHTSHTIEFVVADRNNDGTAERIRYDWSGTPGAPLNKTVNGGTPVALLASVQNFQLTYVLDTKTTTVTPAVDTTEALLASNTSISQSQQIPIGSASGLYSVAQSLPAMSASAPAAATSWNVTRIDFRGSQYSQPNATLHLQVRSSGDPYDSPSSNVQGEMVIPEANISSSTAWNSVTFTTPVRGLSLSRVYDVAWAGTAGESTSPLYLQYADNGTSNVNVSSDFGGSWQYNTYNGDTPLQVFYRVYGTFTKPGTSTNVVRNYATRVAATLQTGSTTDSRVDVSVPLENAPELLSAYWRADFDSDPTAIDLTRDGTLDWKVPGGGAFVPATLVGGVWRAGGSLQTQPLNNFTYVTTVEARCRNTTVGGNGAVVQIGADWAGGLHAPLFFRLQLQSDNTQTLTLYGKSDDTTNVSLCQCTRLSNSFLRIRMTILPSSNVVNLQINDEDQGTFTYPTYAPSADDRFVTMSNDTSNAEFDYVDVRVGEN